MGLSDGLTSSIREQALRGNPPDRSADVLPPSDPNMNLTLPCKCGCGMIGRIDKSLQASGILSWYWWCGGCQSVVPGGTWHPKTEEELVYERWKAAQS